MPVTRIRTQAAQIDQTINQEIIFARLCTTFALLALLIACVGLYGTMSYHVARRTGEIGIRMALGAPRRHGGSGWFLRGVIVLAAVGIAISVPAVLAGSKLVESFLFGMKAKDPLALTVAVATLLCAALLAGYVPARRASRIDPDERPAQRIGVEWGRWSKPPAVPGPCIENPNRAYKIFAFAPPIARA